MINQDPLLLSFLILILSWKILGFSLTQCSHAFFIYFFCFFFFTNLSFELTWKMLATVSLWIYCTSLFNLEPSSHLVVFLLEVQLGTGVLHLPVCQRSSLYILLLLRQSPLQIRHLQLLFVEELCPLVLILLRAQSLLLQYKMFKTLNSDFILLVFSVKSFLIQ